MDGAVSNLTISASFSAVCRSEAGDYLGASAILCRGITGPATVEALACREAMPLPADLGCNRLVIASDCKGVVDDITNRTGGKYITLIKEILAMKQEFVACTFIHENRRTNRDAHSLSKHALGLEVGRHVWLIHPPSMINAHVNISD